MDIYTSYTDSELATLMAEGDDMAFSEIYNRYWDKLFAVALHRCDSQLDAEEIVQNVFYSLWKRRLDLKLQYGLHTYLSVAVKYQVINTLAHKQRRSLHLAELETTEISEDTTDRWLNEKELLAQIERGIKNLPEKCRIVFLLSRHEGKTAKEIATQLGISQKTVEAHMRRALRDLRNSINISLPLLLYLLKK
ncbi:MAG: RNA polymerase sigma-70 factor [Flavobacterium sp.]|nr:MAG: RNA polymerase sigma-70 factor [Flavobacterium sp.]